jgi:ATP-binding cassette subfamily D (ALD) long-chain fatty acid import protein
MADIQGTLHLGFDGVRLEGVPIVAPSLWPRGGEELVESLDITVKEGEHLLILGPNGVGKSSIARVVAGLWPVYRGLVSRPRGGVSGGIMFLSQRVYLAQGTLRVRSLFYMPTYSNGTDFGPSLAKDQAIYPHTEMEMRAAGRSDQELMEILNAVRLGYLPDREGGWDCRKEWKDVLSGGEKQRISVARLLYHVYITLSPYPLRLLILLRRLNTLS